MCRPNPVNTRTRNYFLWRFYCVMRLKPASVICWQRAHSLMLLFCSSEESAGLASAVGAFLQGWVTVLKSAQLKCNGTSDPGSPSPRATPTSLKLSNAERIISWPPLTRQTAARSSNTRALVLSNRGENKKPEQLVNDKCQCSSKHVLKQGANNVENREISQQCNTIFTTINAF